MKRTKNSSKNELLYRVRQVGSVMLVLTGIVVVAVVNSIFNYEDTFLWALGLFLIVAGCVAARGSGLLHFLLDLVRSA
ncbi:hypothetical protein FRACA_2950007 [Frankia canadensis]|uniref:Uncharacterized protein n=1 Tax=Frankia canadensis TaxID=1836972 RepID=A0A2I2KTI2_9ACTN|nr:hypothetical protein FRACA_2950007 [Frankia canadensis]SOU56255.1 hypothetical protein FRACA_2950007 [Frankia canadensis]